MITVVLMLCCGFQASDITAPHSAAAAAANDDDEDDEDDVNNMYVFEGRNYSKEPSAADCQAFQQLVDGCYFSSVTTCTLYNTVQRLVNGCYFSSVTTCTLMQIYMLLILRQNYCASETSLILSLMM